MTAREPSAMVTALMAEIRDIRMGDFADNPTATTKRLAAAVLDHLPREAMARAACCGAHCKNGAETCVANAILPDIDAAIAAARDAIR